MKHRSGISRPQPASRRDQDRAGDSSSDYPTTITIGQPQSGDSVQRAQHRGCHVDNTVPRSASGRAVAAVNGFGYGGTNGHVILTEAPNVPRRPDSTVDHALPDLGASRDAVRDVAAALRSTSVPHRLSTVLRRRMEPTGPSPVPDRAAVLDRDELTQHLDEVSPAPRLSTGRPFRLGPNRCSSSAAWDRSGGGWRRELLAQATGLSRSTAAELDSLFVDIAGWSILRRTAQTRIGFAHSAHRIRTAGQLSCTGRARRRARGATVSNLRRSSGTVSGR